MLNNKFLKFFFNILILFLIFLLILFFIIPWSDWNEDKINESRENFEKNMSK